MTNRNIARVALAAVATLGLVALPPLLAEDVEVAKAGTQPTEAEMMDAMQKHGTLGPEHAKLAEGVGEWTLKMEDLSGSGMTGTGTAKRTMILGGKFLMEEVKGDFAGMPYEGIALVGYDNTLKQFQNVWLDSISTSITRMAGTAQQPDRMETKGEYTCPLVGHTLPQRNVLEKPDADHETLTMYMPGHDGKEAPMLRVTYTRKK